MQSEDKAETRWFVKKPDGDTYYGRIYHGRTYELMPAALPQFTLKGRPDSVDDRSLDIYPGAILSDSDANEVRADEGKSILKYTGGSGNLGGYVEWYYTATQGLLKARVATETLTGTIDVDCAMGDGETDRTALLDFLSFIATAFTCRSISGFNLQHPDYRDYIDRDVPVPVSTPHGLNVRLSRLPPDVPTGD